MLEIFSFSFPRTFEEAPAIVLTSDLSFFHNLLEVDKMEIYSKLAPNMFKVASIFYLVSVVQGNYLALKIPFKESDTWKEKAEAM